MPAKTILQEKSEDHAEQLEILQISEQLLEMRGPADDY